jgi:hypothetical protein
MGEAVFGPLLAVSTIEVDIYICAICGSVELFLSGRATHPLPGTT